MAQTLFTNGKPTTGLTASSLDWTALDTEYNTPRVLSALLNAINVSQKSAGNQRPFGAPMTQTFTMFAKIYSFQPVEPFTPAAASASNWGGKSATSGTSNSAGTLKITNGDATNFALATGATSGTTNTAGTLVLSDASFLFVGAPISYLGAAYTVTAISTNTISVTGSSTISANSQSNGTAVYLMGQRVLYDGKYYTVTAIDPTTNPDIITLQGHTISADSQTNAQDVIVSKRGVLVTIKTVSGTVLKHAVIGVPPVGGVVTLTALPAIVDV